MFGWRRRPGCCVCGATGSAADTRLQAHPIAIEIPIITNLGPGREFDIVRKLLARWGTRAQGIGDDAAVITVPAGEQLVVSTDTSVEQVHFRREWMSAPEIGYRATAAAISDLAAMAAAPLGLVVAITVPEPWRRELLSLGDGIGDAAATSGVPIIGGDLSAGRELALTVTVLGATASPLRRSGAQPGDRICVTGVLGGPGLALRELSAGRTPESTARARLVHPNPRVREARWLAARGATAAIDISDGLVADARHVAAASGVVIDLDLDRVPRVAGAGPVEAASSGEEYELLVAMPRSAAIHDFEGSFRIPLTEIGRVVAHGEAEVRTMLDGASVAPPGGYDHFS
jgi:thiamine-monophosphate kinase